MSTHLHTNKMSSQDDQNIRSYPVDLPPRVKAMFRNRTGRARQPMPPKLYSFILPDFSDEEVIKSPLAQITNVAGGQGQIISPTPRIHDASFEKLRQSSMPVVISHDITEEEENDENEAGYDASDDEEASDLEDEEQQGDDESEESDQEMDTEERNEVEEEESNEVEEEESNGTEDRHREEEQGGRLEEKQENEQIFEHDQEMEEAESKQLDVERESGKESEEEAEEENNSEPNDILKENDCDEHIEGSKNEEESEETDSRDAGSTEKSPNEIMDERSEKEISKAEEKREKQLHRSKLFRSGQTGGKSKQTESEANESESHDTGRQLRRSKRVSATRGNQSTDSNTSRGHSSTAGQYEETPTTALNWSRRSKKLSSKVPYDSPSLNYTVVSTPDMVKMSGPVIGRTKPRRQGAPPPRVSSIDEEHPTDLENASADLSPGSERSSAQSSTGGTPQSSTGGTPDTAELLRQAREADVLTYRLWCGEGENYRKRKAKDITDLDVVLNHFEEITMEFRMNTEDPVFRKALNRAAREIQGELRSTIEQVCTWQNVELSVRRSERQLKKKREELYSLQQRRQQLRKHLVELRKKKAAAEQAERENLGTVDET